MRTDGIENITVQNFKAFRGSKNFQIAKKNVLVYGPNGSGKSSLYFALYTLFQCSAKTVPNIEKYFNNSDENLINIHEPALPSFIEMKTSVAGANRDFRLDVTGVNGDIPNLKELNLSSEFISNRLLINFYNFRNSNEINLIDVFNRDILPFVHGITHFKDKVLSEVIKTIDDRITPMNGMQWRTIKKIQEIDLVNLNREIKSLVDYINANATQYLEDNFQPNDIKIALTYRGAYQIEQRTISNKKKYYLIPPFYKLSIETKMLDNSWKPVDRPQSFLNEARLTKIGIAVRFCLLGRRIQNVPLKTLVLDDILVSLDMNNRSELINMLLEKYHNDYQLFLFTHDLEFHNEIKRLTSDDTENWAYFEFDEILTNKTLNYRDGKTSMQKAKRYFEDHDLDACALELRKIGENVVSNFLAKKMNIVFDHKEFVTFGQKLTEAKNQIDKASYLRFQSLVLNEGLDFTDPDYQKIADENFALVKADHSINGGKKARMIAARRDLFKLIFDLNKSNFEALKIIDEVRKLKDRILNHGAHPHGTSLYRKEVEDGINLMGRLEKVLSKVTT